MSPSSVELAGIVVHWHGQGPLRDLVAAWPLEDPRFELLVVDNGSLEPLTLPAPVRLLTPGRNLGFAGGVNYGLRHTSAPLLLLLNPDARPETGALDSLLRGFCRNPEASGLAPRLLGPRGEPQFAWQLRSLPTPWGLVLQTLLLPGARAPRREPPPLTPVEQPAAAALALRRQALSAVGGLDETFFPAWFEDVDLAHRLRESGHRIVYWPEACFSHQLGGSLPSLGYGPFLWIYYRNLVAYLTKHHGGPWPPIARVALVVGLTLRLTALPLRLPRRAQSFGEAWRGLVMALRGALSHWRGSPPVASVEAPAPAQDVAREGRR